MTNRYSFYQMARLAVLAGLVVLAPGIASAQRAACPVLKGTYIFTFSGTQVLPGSATPVPYNGVGVQTFDGAGKYTGTESANFGVLVLRSAPISGTYKVNPDCTGTTTAIFPDGSSGTADFVISNEGKTIHAVGVDNMGPGSTVTITFTKITDGR